MMIALPTAARRVAALLLASTALAATAMANGNDNKPIEFNGPKVAEVLGDINVKYMKSFKRGDDLVAFFKNAPTTADYSKALKAANCEDAVPMIEVFVAQGKAALKGQLKYIEDKGDKIDAYEWNNILNGTAKYNFEPQVNAWKATPFVDLVTPTSAEVFTNSSSLREKCIKYATARQSECMVWALKKLGGENWYMPGYGKKISVADAKAFAQAQYGNPAFFSTGLAITIFADTKVNPDFIKDFANGSLEGETFAKGNQAAFDRLVKKDEKPDAVKALFSGAPGVNINVPPSFPQNAAGRKIL